MEQVQLYINGLIDNPRQFWAADISFNRLMREARRGLRSALSRLANEPRLTANRPATVSDNPATLTAVLESIQADRRRRINDMCSSRSEADRDALYKSNIALLPATEMVTARIHQYNTLVTAYNQALDAIEEAKAAGETSRVQQTVAHFIFMHAAGID